MKTPRYAERLLCHLAATDPWSAGWIVGSMWSALTPKQRAAVWAQTRTPQTRDLDHRPRAFAECEPCDGSGRSGADQRDWCPTCSGMGFKAVQP